MTKPVLKPARRPHRRMKTVDLCFFKEEDGSPCSMSVSWKLKASKSGDSFKVCDAHLAWGIRLSGAPALVEEFVAPEDVKKTEPD